MAVWPRFRDCSLGTPIGVWSLLAQRDHRRKMLQERASRSCLKHGSIFLSQTAFFKQFIGYKSCGINQGEKKFCLTWLPSQLTKMIQLTAELVENGGVVQ